MAKAATAAIDQILVSGSNFLVISMAAKMLSPEDVALYVYGFSLYVFFNAVANAWIYQNLMLTPSQNPGKLVESMLFAGLNFFLSLAAVPITYVAYLIITPNSTPDHMELGAMISILVAINILMDYERRLRYFVECAVIKNPVFVSGIGYLPRVILLWVIQPSSIFEFTMVVMAASVPLTLMALWRALHCKFDIEFFKFSKMQLSSGVWMSASIPINWLWNQAPLFLTGSVFGMAAAGIYATIKNITKFANVAMEMIPTYVASRLSSLYKEDKDKYVKYIFKIVLAAFSAWVGIMWILIWFGGELLDLLYGERYAGHVWILWLLWGFNIFVLLNRIQFLHLHLKGKTRIVPVSYLIGLAAIVLTFYMFSSLGEAVSALSMLIGGIVSTIILSIPNILNRYKIYSGQDRT